MPWYFYRPHLPLRMHIDDSHVRGGAGTKSILSWLAGWSFTVATDSELPDCSFFRLHSLFTGSVEKLLSHY